MASHQDNHGQPAEKKPVSFTVPLILAVVTWVIILSLVRLGDPCCCHGETCAKEGTEAHGKGHAEGQEVKSDEMKSHGEEAPVKSEEAPAKSEEAPAKTEEGHEGHGH